MKNQGKTSRKVQKRARFLTGDSTNSTWKPRQKAGTAKIRSSRQSCPSNKCDPTQPKPVQHNEQHNDGERRESGLLSSKSSISTLEKAGSSSVEENPENIDLTKMEVQTETKARTESDYQPQNNDASEDVDKDEEKRDVKHIRPCICDLSTRQRKRIHHHVMKTKKFEKKLVQRLEEIDAERIALEEEIRRKEAEAKEHQELFGDTYEVVGKKKKRLKRSARRASMVSLGVKQVINWKKQPRIKVKENKVSQLRKSYTSYCGERPLKESPPRKIDIEVSPKVPIRATRTAVLRTESNVKKIKYLLSLEDKRPRFVLAPLASV